MMFLVPFFIDPAWSTLQADFDVNGTNCYTTTGFERKGIENIFLNLVKQLQFTYYILLIAIDQCNPFQFLGRSNCTWSSCQEGCTKTVYSCWQIEVQYYLNDTNQVQAGRLFTNVKVMNMNYNKIMIYLFIFKF